MEKKIAEEQFGTFDEEGVLYFRRLLPGPIERVWSYLTQPEKRKRWLAGGEWELKEGGRVVLAFDNAALSPVEEEVPEKYREFEEGETVMYGKVTRIDPPRLLAHTWLEEQDPGHGGESEVTYELTPKGDLVLLELTHRRLGDGRELRLGVSAGWHTHLDILADVLEGRQPGGFWKAHMAWEARYEKRLNAS